MRRFVRFGSALQQIGCIGMLIVANPRLSVPLLIFCMLSTLCGLIIAIRFAFVNRKHT